MRRLCSAMLVATVVLAGCTTFRPGPDPSPADSPERAAAELAVGLTKKDLSAVEFVGATGAEVNALYQPLVAGMGPRQAEVTVGGIAKQAGSATATLNVVWTFPGVPQKWSYAAEAPLSEEGGRWKTNWRPNLVQPQLDGSNRLSQVRLDPERGELLGEAGDPIVQLRPVVRIGIDKSRVAAAALDSSSRRLARLV